MTQKIRLDLSDLTSSLTYMLPHNVVMVYYGLEGTTLPRKNMNLPYSIHTFVLNEFLTADRSCTIKYF